MSTNETLGLLLIRHGLINRPQLYDALRLQRENSRLLGTCLLSLGYVEPTGLMRVLSEQLGIPALPPGSLRGAHAEATQRVPGDLAWRLRVLPYSWDGNMLGVAVADGRALNHLQEVAFHAQAAIGAYLALEIEIETVLRTVYPLAAPSTGEIAPGTMQGRPRPAKAGSPQEIPSRDFGVALGLDADGPLLLARRKTAEQLEAQRPRVIRAAPPPAAKVATTGAAALPVFERIGFYDAVELIYEASGIGAVGTLVGRALLNYFTNVVVLAVEDKLLKVTGYAGGQPNCAEVSLQLTPQVVASLAGREIAYGQADEDPRAAELVRVLGLPDALTAFLAAVSVGGRPRLLVYADNGQATELYEDLHDVELLFKEAETALGMLAG